MSITTYSELQTAVANWLERDDLTSRIPEFITLAEARFNRRLRLAQMTSLSTATIDTTNRYSAVPTDFLEVRAFALADGSTDYELTPATPAAVARYRADDNTTDRPRQWALTGTSSGRQFEFFPAPDASYTVTLTYYAKIPALSDANTTNWLLSLAPDAYLHGAIAEAAVYLRDGDLGTAARGLSDAALDELKASNRTPGGRLRTEVAGMFAPTTYDFTNDA